MLSPRPSFFNFNRGPYLKTPICCSTRIINEIASFAEQKQHSFAVHYQPAEKS
jgi:hypothetical protein